MSIARRLAALFLTCAASACPGAAAAEVFFDRLEDALTFSAGDPRYRARVSGLLDLEGYALQLPAPGVLHGEDELLFSPRLSVFVDAQFGQTLYFFAQARVDRGFDPGPVPADARLDEYALRYTPGRDRRLVFQVGKFATLVGNWAARHGSWSNAFVTAPVPYEHLTGIWDTEALTASGTLLQWAHVRGGVPVAAGAAEKSLRVPIVWGPSYTVGAALAAEIGHLNVTVEAKAGSLSSRPEAWQHAAEQRAHPTFSGRLGYRPSPTWNFGVSASGGAYLREFAERTLPAGQNRGDFRQFVVAHDVAFAWHHWQVWAEVFASRFEIPPIGDADTVAYYVEARYKFTPQFSGAVRWNEQWFGTIPHRGTRTTWGNEIWRIDVAPAYRFTPHTQLKFQYTLQRGDAAGRELTQLWATQFTLRF